MAAVLEDAPGSPCFLHLYGHRSVEGAPGDTITPARCARLRPALLRGLDDMFFEGRSQRATPRSRAVLHAMVAAGGESATVKQLVEKGLIENNERQPLLANPVDEGLVSRPGRGLAAFTAPMLGAILRRAAPAARPVTARENSRSVKGACHPTDTRPGGVPRQAPSRLCPGG